MKIVDIGCGRKKMKGAIGIDFSELSDADIVLDLNIENFPFEDNSIDFFYSSHALEHLTVDGFLNVLNEVYRCLTPEGQFLVLVPYFQVDLNYANVFHNNQIAFNEHTFRFFSSDENCKAIKKEDYATASCQQWGLRYSANSELSIELETLAIKFYYFDEYKQLSNEDKVRLRRSKTNVVEQISYHLKPIKPCPIKPETGPVDDNVDKHQYIIDQIKYFTKQLEYIKSHIISRRSETEVELFINRKDELFQEYKKLEEEEGFSRDNEIYIFNGLIFPAAIVVAELNERISTLQCFIDDFIEALS